MPYELWDNNQCILRGIRDLRTARRRKAQYVLVHGLPMDCEDQIMILHRMPTDLEHGLRAVAFEVEE